MLFDLVYCVQTKYCDTPQGVPYSASIVLLVGQDVLVDTQQGVPYSANIVLLVGQDV